MTADFMSETIQIKEIISVIDFYRKSKMKKCFPTHSLGQVFHSYPNETKILQKKKPTNQYFS